MIARGGWELEFVLPDSLSDAGPFTTQHSIAELGSCVDRAADKLRAEEQGHLEGAVGPITPDDGELRTEIGGVLKRFQNFVEIPSPVVYHEFHHEDLHQLDERRDSLIGDSQLVSSPPRPLIHVEWW